LQIFGQHLNKLAIIFFKEKKIYFASSLNMLADTAFDSALILIQRLLNQRIKSIGQLIQIPKPYFGLVAKAVPTIFRSVVFGVQLGL
jgi:hypothetical protein